MYVTVYGRWKNATQGCVELEMSTFLLKSEMGYFPSYKQNESKRKHMNKGLCKAIYFRENHIQMQRKYSGSSV